MKRDGANKSLWQDLEIGSRAQVSDVAAYDVIIAGAGITGVTLGYFLQKSGKKCLILESNSAGFGTTGGTTAHINTFYDAQYDKVINDFGEENAKLLAEVGSDVISQITTIINKNQISCEFERRDAYVFALDEKQTVALDKMYEATVKVGISAERVSENPFPIPFDSIIKITDQAQFHPLQYLQSVLSAFIELGGTIKEGETVISVSEEKDIVEVITADRQYKTSDFVWATHVVPNINRMNFLVAPYRSYAIAFTLKSGQYPKAQGADMSDPYHYYRSQVIDGKSYVIAGGEDHKTGHQNNAEECFTQLESYVRKFFDVDEVTNRWSSQYYSPSDGLPFIGRSPGDHHIYWATGYDGNGMTFGTLSAMLISDLILEKTNKYEKLFDPARLNVKAGFVDLIKENADATFQLVKDLFSGEKIKSVEEIENGEGKTVNLDGKTISIYRDEEGVVYAVNSKCTHMGCHVGWNATEKSWDCPCHGARFAIDGRVLNGPATIPLERVNINELKDTNTE